MPGEEQTRAALVEQTDPLKEAYDLVPEELFGGRGADVRHGQPLAGAGPAAAGNERVNVGMRVELIPERLRHRDHTGAKALLLTGRYGHQLADGLPGRGAERAQQLPDLAGAPAAEVAVAQEIGEEPEVGVWATWCAPCRSRVPRFVALQAKDRKQGLEVVGISLDESAEPVRAFRKELGMTYRVALGDEKVAKRWGGILGLPVAFVVDRTGRQRARHEGEADLSAIEKDVERLLRAK